MIQCKICQKEFATEGGLHKHLKAILLQWRNIILLFILEIVFYIKRHSHLKINRTTLVKTFIVIRVVRMVQESSDIVGEYIIKKLKQRVDSKQLKHAPRI